MGFSEGFKKNIREVYGADGESWLKNLPQQLKELASQWDFELEQVHPYLTYGFVGFIKFSSGKEAVLKMSPPLGPLSREVEWLKIHSGIAPEVFLYSTEYSALAMERLQPGYTVKRLVIEGQDELATRTLARAIRQLNRKNTASVLLFQPLSQLSAAYKELEGRLDKYLVDKAKGLFKELTAPGGEEVLLHGDLHHDNVLQSEDAWKVIDPHGYIGDPVFEVGPLFYNPNDYPHLMDPLEKVLDRRLGVLAEELPFDRQRMHAWAYCMTLLSAAWSGEEQRPLPAREIEIARVLNKMM
ncbi:aminoglycoside phosphotransferase family protein [Bdellovibrio sp. 22V]|uniref:aminoglycoside phosphotransferase family protein n=1 Tax=Bdellovibrio TaxID=958 RepID=UPI002542CC69|nr:aminoglycoside phosphotransferase family protein [Bdellovibrio sp. 22V]WII73578.1 aminoglycoside phosphotransferase family protein [Bdellovibrio sp. 22V]